MTTNDSAAAGFGPGDAAAAEAGTGRLRILTNLVALLDRPGAGDFRALAHLVQAQGAAATARVQDDLDALLDSPDRRMVSAAILVMSDRRRIEALLLADGESPESAAALADLAEEQAWHLLVTGIDGPPTGADPGRAVDPGSRSDFDVRRWRLLLAPLLVDPWSDAPGDLARRVEETGDPWLRRLLEGCSAVIRARQADVERRAIARQIRHLVATSGVTQREFSELIGTSQSRFSTYVNGHVTPSATLMLRITRTARLLRQRAAERAEREVRSAS